MATATAVRPMGWQRRGGLRTVAVEGPSHAAGATGEDDDGAVELRRQGSGGGGNPTPFYQGLRPFNSLFATVAQKNAAKKKQKKTSKKQP